MGHPNLKAKLDAIFHAHMSAELAGDLDQTLATMAKNPHLVNVPMMVGGLGAASARAHDVNRLIVGSFRSTQRSKQHLEPTVKNGF
jgi:carboxymethylenebutenolidase